MLFGQDKPPNPRSVGSTQLNIAHEKLQARVRSALNGKVMTLQQDGWTNIKDDPIIATCISREGKGYFLDAKEPGAQKKNTDLCKDMLLESKKFTEEKYGCNMKNVCTDNENKNKKMWVELKSEESGLNAYGCASHILEKLARDVIPSDILEYVL